MSWIFEEIADLLEIKGEEAFKARTYRRAANTIAHLPVDLSEVRQAGQLAELPGIGKSLAAKLEELLDTGRLVYLERLRDEVPESLRDLMAIPGVGRRTASLLFKELHVRSIEEVEAAARAHRIRQLPRLGVKTEQRILHGLQRLRSRTSRTNLGLALPVAEGLTDLVRRFPGVNRAEYAGSARRGEETVGDLDIVASAGDPEPVMEAFCALPFVREVLAKGPTRSSILTQLGLQVDLRVVAKDEFVTAWHHFTGSKEHNVRLRGLARDLGLKINEYGVFRQESGGAEEERLGVVDETDIYAALGLSYIPPELRQDTGEVEAAAVGTIPDLIELAGIKGDLHCHSDWSDGVNTIEQMARAARERGYEYLAIADHSQALAMAGGLTPEKLGNQGEVIRRLNARWDDFRLLRAIEVDILGDGRMDLPDEVLADLDYVTASIHSGFRQDRERLTSRIEAAMRSPHVDAISHPTGRLIGRRDSYEVDIDRIIRQAARTGTALEVNASPDRLDLKDQHVRQAIASGVKIVINTDAHEASRLAEMRFGVLTARRGWATAADVINTKGGSELMDWLSRPKDQRR
ncbi:MAG: DNA polymerase/3'-5' exonuclease PolX [Bacillota bacterium]